MVEYIKLEGESSNIIDDHTKPGRMCYYYIRDDNGIKCVWCTHKERICCRICRNIKDANDNGYFEEKCFNPWISKDKEIKLSKDKFEKEIFLKLLPH